VLAAHIDSKITPAGFVGATDSIVPVAIIIYLIQELDYLISASQQEIKIFLFDGEEAFVSWSSTDRSGSELTLFFSQYFHTSTDTALKTVMIAKYYIFLS